MSCAIGVVPANHPQQVAVNGADDSKDDRRTPYPLFAALDEEFGPFTVDVAASAENALCNRFYDKTSNGLAQSWAGEIVWGNVPYSSIAPWIEKAIEEIANGCLRVVFLLPANRTEQAWWQELIEPVRDRGLGVMTRFLPGRPRFGSSRHPKGQTGCPFGCVVVVFEPGEAE